MILKVAMPGKVQFKLIRREPAFFMAHEGDIHYIGGADVLPAPLETEQENEVIQDLATEEYAQEARSILIEHNLRLVVYIAKKFDNTGVGVEDLISIGTIGLIKSINTFNPGKNIKLATYASRCIENEILMYLRRNHKTRMEVSIDEPLNVDWDGNELLLSDILGTDEDVIYRDMENEAERRILRLIGLGQTIGPAFADFAPGLAPLDWLVGIVGAVGFRLLIYFKSKNAKKFRRDAEYGSARWGTEKDIKPFVDPKFENNVILTGTEFLTMNTRPKIPANARNLNCCIIGSSGSGKTRFWLTPQLLQAHSSYVVVDPKGGVLGQIGAFLQKRGYKIKVFNSIDFSKSMHYNPLAYIRNEADILKFVDALISNTKGEGKEGDPFWTKSETLLYCALIAYIIFEGPAEDRNMNTLVDMISGMEVKEDDEDFMNAVDYMFAGLEKRKPDCFAVKQYKKYKLASGDICSK